VVRFSYRMVPEVYLGMLRSLREPGGPPTDAKLGDRAGRIYEPGRKA
jgi:hypothetical protein